MKSTLFIYSILFTLSFVFATTLATPPTYAQDPIANDMHNLYDVISLPPQDGDSCFSPDEDCSVKLIALIDTAKSTLDIAIYNLTLNEIRDAILKAHKRGIQVRMVVDKKEAINRGSRTRDLFKAGIQMKYGIPEGLMHNKFTIVDGTMLETGSYNYTFFATNKNNENQIYSNNPKLIKRFQENFEKLWHSAENYFEQAIPAASSPHPSAGGTGAGSNGAKIQ